MVSYYWFGVKIYEGYLCKVNDASREISAKARGISELGI